MDLTTPVSAETMRKLDRRAAATGIATLSLMENAGSAVARKADEILHGRSKGKIAVFCGKGNNGGDGFVAARKLIQSGFEVDIYLFGKQQAVKNDAAANLELLRAECDTIHEIESAAYLKKLEGQLGYGLLIDALLGTGFSGSISGLLRVLIELLNKSGAPLLSVDVPSGLNATTGIVSPVSVKANWTISFGLSKKGFYINDGPGVTGEIHIVNIGFTEALLREAIQLEKTHT